MWCQSRGGEKRVRLKRLNIDKETPRLQEETKKLHNSKKRQRNSKIPRRNFAVLFSNMKIECYEWLHFNDFHVENYYCHCQHIDRSIKKNINRYMKLYSIIGNLCFFDLLNRILINRLWCLLNEQQWWF